MKISEYQQTTQLPNPASSPTPVAHATEVAPAPDLSGFVRGLAVAADMHERSMEDNGKAWSAAQTAKTRLDWTQEFYNRSQNADPGAPDFTPSFLKDYDEYANKLLDSAPDQLSKRFLHQRLQMVRYELGDKAIEFEAKARIDYRMDQYTQGIDNSRKLMNTDPTQYKDTLGEQLALIDNAGIDPIKKSALRQKAIDGISEAAVWSQIQQSPSNFLDSIGIGPSGRARKSDGNLQGKTGNDAFDALPFDKRGQMFEQAIRLKAQLDVDADRQAAKMKDAIAQDAGKTLWAAWGDGKLTRNMIDQYRAVLPVAEYGSFVKMAEAPDRNAKSDPAIFRQIQRYIADDQPNAAIDLAFTAHKSDQLSNADLASEVARARSMTRQEGPKSQYERSRAYITTSLDPGPLVHDPVGRSRLAEALDAFDTWQTAAKRDDVEIDKRAKELVGQYRLVNMNDTAAGLPMPRSGTIPRDISDPAKTKAAIAKAGLEAQRRHDAGIYNDREYQDELAVMNRWRKLVDGNKR